MSVILNPFGLARWFLDKFAYWLFWSILFLVVMAALTQIGNSRALTLIWSFAAFWITTFLMSYVRERVLIK